MSQQNRLTLKGYFQTGSVPSQSEFADMIDSFIDMVDDQVYVDSGQNVGLGLVQPPARLAIKSVAGYSIPATLSLTVGNSNAPVQLSGNASLATLLYVGDVIQVTGVSQLFAVAEIMPDVSIQLTPVPELAIANAAITVLKNLLYIGDGSCEPELVFTQQGKLGIGVALPSQQLDVNGNVKANSFIGDGSALNNLLGSNIVGQITLGCLPTISFSSLSGQATPAQLPALSFGAIQGTLSVSQLPPNYNPGSTGITSFSADNPAVPSGAAITFSWNVTGADYIMLSYLLNYAVTDLDSRQGQITFPTGSYAINPDVAQTVTLTAYKNNVVLDQAQITLTVIPPIQNFMQQCSQQSINPSAATVAAASAFGLGNLCCSNVTLLATGMKGVFSDDAIYEAISAYYRSLTFSWDANTNGSWINAVLYSSFPNGTTNFTGAYAIKNWTEYTSAPVASLWNLTQLPQAITLNTDPTWQASADWMTVIVAATGLIRFDWACSSGDGTQNPCSYSVNNVQVQLNSSASSGTASVLVNVGDVFAISCASNNASPTSLAISNFMDTVAPVPNDSTNFTGAYAIKNWTEYTPIMGVSLWNLTQLPQAITLNPDEQSIGDWMSVNVAATGLIRFDWACSSRDGPQDPCTYSVNYMQQVQLNTWASSSGTASVLVNVGDVFTISCGSNTSLTISNFIAPVAPVPPTA